MKICPICLKNFTDNTPDKHQIFCSNKCKQKYYNKYSRKEKSIINPKKYTYEYYPNKNRDEHLKTKEWQRNIADMEKNKGLEFNQDDNNWGVGESNLLEHRVNDEKLEAYYIKKELKRISSRKPNK